MPILNAEVPIVASGTEYIVPQLASEKFTKIAERPGQVIDEDPNHHLTIQYDNGKTDRVDILPRYATTKRNSAIQISLNSLHKGDTFQKGQMIAWSNSFNGDALTIGKNVPVAIMSYHQGKSFEDQYAISEDMSESFVTESVSKVSIIVPPDTKLLFINNNIGINTSNKDVLIEFQYLDTLESYIDQFDEIVNDEYFDEDLEAIIQKSKNSIRRFSPGGEISDIRIYISNRNKVDPEILKLWDLQRQKISKLSKDLLTYRTGKEDSKLLNNIDFSVLKTGFTKFEGAKIDFYIKRPKELLLGDKISGRQGNKGVVGHIIPKDTPAIADYTGRIDLFMSPCGVLGRKNTSIIKELYISKIFYFLPKIIIKKFQDNEKIEDIKNLIIQIYTLLDPTKDKRNVLSITEKLNQITPANLKAGIENNKIFFNIIIPPFNPIDINNIQQAAKILRIPLNETVEITEFGGIKTKIKVPVGFLYFGAMEQLSSDYESTRSTAGYISSTGQPTQGKRKSGGQSIGELDINALLSYDAKDTLKELMTARSDNLRTKRQMLRDLRESGKTFMESWQDEEKGQSSLLLSIYLTGCGLFTNL
jgi:DNA-directed RNA polymerase beta subunit